MLRPSQKRALAHYYEQATFCDTGKGVTWFPRREAAKVRFVYELTHDDKRFPALTWCRDAGKLRPFIEIGYKLSRKAYLSLVPACPWCGARPSLWERDESGWHNTATCGSEQCGGPGGSGAWDRFFADDETGEQA